jgi:hypothetical protein
MTKKDYEVIAEILIRQQKVLTQKQLSNLIRTFCEVLQEKSPLFEEHKFLAFIKKQASK